MTGATLPGGANPFSLPGIPHDQPLYAYHELDHDAWYLEVDHTEIRYAEFRQRYHESVGSPSGPNGRLFVVYGGDRCGKTSFVNRCVRWIEAGRRGVVLDVRTAATVRDVQRDRLTRVARQVAGSARTKGLLANPGSEAPSEPAEIYAWLNDELADGVVLVVLLPVGTDVPGEIAEYSRFARGRLVFVLESAHQEDHALEMRDIRSNGFLPPVVLRLGGLTPDDIIAFVTHRLGGPNRPSGSHPYMSEEDLKRLSGTPMTIGQLQTLLYRVYQERLEARDRYSEVECVTYQDLLSWFFRWGMGHGWGEADER